MNNPLKGWTLHRLTQLEAQRVAETLSLAERRVLWAWRSDWSEWRSLLHADCAVLLEGKSEKNPDAPPVPMLPVEDEVTSVQIHKHQKPEHTREHERVALRVPVEIIVGNQTFRTNSENVSEGGLKFVDRLPDWVAGYFTVALNIPDLGPLEITCMLVEDQKLDKTRVEAVETDDEESHLPKFRNWVRSMISTNPRLVIKGS